jgi:acyl dehydratase
MLPPLTAATVLDGIDAVRAAAGTTSACQRLARDHPGPHRPFADATGDHQWIHVDPERAAAESPFGGPIAHGYLTLSLTNFLPQIVEVRGFAMGLNYGTNKVRFPAPVPVGSKLRAGAELTDVDDIPGGVQTTMTVTVEVDGQRQARLRRRVLSRFLT